MKTFSSQILNEGIRTIQNFTLFLKQLRKIQKMANKKGIGEKSVQNWTCQIFLKKIFLLFQQTFFGILFGILLLVNPIKLWKPL